LQTKNDEEIAALIISLPNDWKVTNACGKTKTKKDIMRCAYGVQKEADNIVNFQLAILKAYPPAEENVAQFDTMLVGSIEYDRKVWRRHHVFNSIFKETLTEPLQHSTSVYLIYSKKENHYVTLVVDRKKFYFYDSLKSIYSNTYSVSGTVKKIYNALNKWYGDNPGITKPVILSQAYKVSKQRIPLQEDGWSCGMHMLLVALSTIYQGKKPEINYTKEHAYVLSRAHLHFELTGEILPCVNDIVEILKLNDKVSYQFVHKIHYYIYNITSS
jgi:hypothetical protein